MIRLVSLLEYPSIALHAGQPFAARGCSFDWDSIDLNGEHINDKASSFYEGVLRDARDEINWQPDRINGTLVAFRLVNGRPLLVGNIPSHVYKSPGLGRRRIKDFLGSGQKVNRVIGHAANGFLMQHAILHGTVNMNSQILGACEAIETGASANTHLLTIKKATHHIRSIASSARVLSPDWKPDLARSPLNSIHQNIRMQIGLWQSEFDRRKLTAALGTCHQQIHMDSDILSTVLMNIFSNASKYCQSSSTLNISFEQSAGNFLVHFDMTSRNIDPDEVGKICRAGERGKGANADGEGMGLAVVQHAMQAYGGDVSITAGQPDYPRGYTSNRFTLSFPSSLVRGAS